MKGMFYVIERFFVVFMLIVRFVVMLGLWVMDMKFGMSFGELLLV